MSDCCVFYCFIADCSFQNSEVHKVRRRVSSDCYAEGERSHWFVSSQITCKRHGTVNVAYLSANWFRCNLILTAYVPSVLAGAEICHERRIREGAWSQEVTLCLLRTGGSGRNHILATFLFSSPTSTCIMFLVFTLLVALFCIGFVFDRDYNSSVPVSANRV